MPESAVPGLFRCRVEWTGFLGVSGSLFNVLHYLDTADPQHDYTNQEVADIVADSVESFWEDATITGGLPILSYYDIGQPSTVYAKNLNKDLIEAAGATGAGPATSAFSQLPAECAICVSLGTETAGKSYRGRVYLPPPSTASLSTAGTIATATVNAIKSSFDEWLRAAGGNALQVADLDLCVYSRTLDVATLVTSTRVNNTWDSQRGRGLR